MEAPHKKPVTGEASAFIVCWVCFALSVTCTAKPSVHSQRLPEHISTPREARGSLIAESPSHPLIIASSCCQMVAGPTGPCQHPPSPAAATLSNQNDTMTPFKCSAVARASLMRPCACFQQLLIVNDLCRQAL